MHDDSTNILSPSDKNGAMIRVIMFQSNKRPLRITLLSFILVYFFPGLEGFALLLRPLSLPHQHHELWMVAPTRSATTAHCQHFANYGADTSVTGGSRWTTTTLWPKSRLFVESRYGLVLHARNNRRVDKSEDDDGSRNSGESGSHGEESGRESRRKGRRGQNECGGTRENDQGETWGGEARRSRLQEREKAEFSRTIDPSELTGRPKLLRMEATAEECSLLAKRFSLGSIQTLRSEARVYRGTGTESRKLEVKGRVVSKFTQLCYATRAPFSVTVDEEFQTIVQEVSWDSVQSTLWALETDTETDDEIMEGDLLDVGEITAQEVGLLIDPFGRHPEHIASGEEEMVYTLGDFDGLQGDQKWTADDTVEDMDAMNKFFNDD